MAKLKYILLSLLIICELLTVTAVIYSDRVHGFNIEFSSWFLRTTTTDHMLHCGIIIDPATTQEWNFDLINDPQSQYLNFYENWDNYIAGIGFNTDIFQFTTGGKMYFGSLAIHLLYILTLFELIALYLLKRYNKKQRVIQLLLAIDNEPPTSHPAS